MKPSGLYGNLSRRDFLKFLSRATVMAAFQPLGRVLGNKDTAGQPNMIVLVFDAWSAHDVDLYGYPRRTMPALEMFAGDALVYHNHFSPATFTVPGTASLLTGLYPWSHRALQLGSGIIRPLVDREAFALLRGALSTFGFAQNTYADVIMSQAGKDLDVHLKTGSFDLQDDLLYNLPFFKNDLLISYAALEDDLFQLGGIGDSGSLFLAPLDNYWLARSKGAL